MSTVGCEGLDAGTGTKCEMKTIFSQDFVFLKGTIKKDRKGKIF